MSDVFLLNYTLFTFDKFDHASIILRLPFFYESHEHGHRSYTHQVAIAQTILVKTLNVLKGLFQTFMILFVIIIMAFLCCPF